MKQWMVALITVTVVAAFFGGVYLMMLKKAGQSPPEAEEPLKVEGFEIVFEGDDAFIVGEVTNHRSKEYAVVMISFGIMNERGHKIGSVRDVVNNLAPGQTWDYRAAVRDPEAATIKLEKVTAF